MKTPQQSYPDLAQAIGVPELYLKREDLHKYGSHKGRSIPTMIKKYFKDPEKANSLGASEGLTDFVISSSGNAALAAIRTIQAHNLNNPSKLKLTVYIGQNINPKKLEMLMAEINDPNVKMEQVERPRQKAFQMDKKGQAKNLRQSTDDLALLGYYELAEELNKISNLQAIFIPTSSGTTAQALGEAFAKLNPQVQIHIVQTEKCHPIAEEFDQTGGMTNASLSPADAIVDKVAHRKERVVEVIKNSRGSGWIVSDEEIKEARKLVQQTIKLQISPNSALSIAGVKKAIENKWKWGGAVVCLITGK